jgi:WD40 repeat protein
MEYQSNPHKIVSIKKHNNIIFTGDSMGSIKVYSFISDEQEPQLVSDNMGSHTAQITAILVRDERIYTFSLDNKYSIWKLDNYTRITTINDVHKQGIICAEEVGDRVVSCGGDLLVKVH